MYVYWWHVGGLRAVKLGHADDPGQQVRGYRSEHGVSGQDLRGYKLESSIDAEWVERQLCRLLETRGFRRIALPPGDEEGELFALDGRTFEDAHELLREAARHIALAEASNQRKKQMRQEPQVAQAWAPRRQEQWAPRRQEQKSGRVHEQRRPRPQPAAAPSLFPITGRRWLYLIGAIVLACLAAGLIDDDDVGLSSRSASLMVPQHPSAVPTASQDGEASSGPPRTSPCDLVKLGETLVDVRCLGSWARMRWAGRWVLDAGHNESDAIAYFNASDTARRVVAPPAREPPRPVSEQATVKPERLPESNPSATPSSPPPQPRPQQTVSRPAAVQPQQPRETPPRPPEQCTVSRPKPGFQVYLVTCPNSRVTIGRTVDVPTGWTVSEGVNASEAVDFFMKSPYAR
jgi:hypothetical protein